MTALSDQHTHIVSTTPSRTRIRVSAKRRTPREMERITQALQTQPGVHSVRPNLKTGSIVIHHSADPNTIGAITGTLRDLNVILFQLLNGEMPEPDGKSEAADGLITALDDLNQRVGQATDGLVDLRVLFPLSLGGLAVYQFLRNGWQIETAPWYVLAYYAFDSFIKLHYTQPTNDAEPQQR